MSLKKSTGNMYPWVTHTHSHLIGACSHACGYCYVQAMAKRFHNMRANYSGEVRLVLDELHVHYGNGKTIFIEHLNDLFADGVPTEYIAQILKHCNSYPDNHYVFQTKNPKRMLALALVEALPPHSILGTTIETNHWYPVMGKAPPTLARAAYMSRLPARFQRFVTIEPILDFDLEPMVRLLTDLNPNFVNIGADSKGHGLIEPKRTEVLALISELQSAGIEVRQKSNLDRLTQ